MSDMEGTLGGKAALPAPVTDILSADGHWRWNGRDWVPAAPPQVPFRWPAVARAASGWIVLTVAVAGLFFDHAVLSGALGLAASAVILIAAFAVYLRVDNPWARGCAAAAAFAGAGLTLRASPWLQLPDLAAALALLFAAAALARGGTPFDLGLRSAGALLWRSTLHVLAAPSFLLPPALRARGRLVEGRRKLVCAVLRGLVIGMPVVVVVLLLLASADPVFASFLNLNIDAAAATRHVFLWCTGTWIVGGLVRAASGEAASSEPRTAWRLGAAEVITPLVLLDLVFLGFASAQLVAALGAGGDALRSAGITYSDYARSGFFQLLWVAAITFVSIMALAALLRIESQRAMVAFRLLATAAVVLTIVVVAVAWRRLSLYEDAYGWTMLRLYSHAFAAWIALAFLVLIAWIAGAGTARRSWIYGALAVTGLAALVALNALNPEALVVQRNVARTDTTTFDPAYLAELSSDAVLESLSPGVPTRYAAELRLRACAAPPPPDGWAAFTVASATARARRAEVCH